ncbi:hypothetical protein NDU88_003714 [Pleurodeles waltl]|uniref:Uncharacterized protein n=1 Tax=Pleurodeles waltl TaxID=8319 RepID=A0AAV7LJA4_PLEWA|nr:hypothetical protein NDU88_003714 [Pleurodeles waltl]
MPRSTLPHLTSTRFIRRPSDVTPPSTHGADKGLSRLPPADADCGNPAPVQRRVAGVCTKLRLRGTPWSQPESDCYTAFHVISCCRGIKERSFLPAWDPRQPRPSVRIANQAAGNRALLRERKQTPRRSLRPPPSLPRDPHSLCSSTLGSRPLKSGPLARGNSARMSGKSAPGAWNSHCGILQSHLLDVLDHWIIEF